MQIPLQIISPDLPLTEAIENRIRLKVKKLHHFYDHIISCRINIKVPNKHHHKGKLYNVRIDLKIPGKEIPVTKESEEDLYAAIRDAFHAARRKLEDTVQLQRGFIKHHQSSKLITD